MIRIFVPEASPSLNKYAYAHWRVQHRDKERWGDMLFYACARVSAPKAIGRRRVIVERYGKRALDPDNGAGGCKIILDGLRKLGMLVDDNDRFVELVFRNMKLERGEKPHTAIWLEDL